MRLKKEWRGVHFEPIIVVHDEEETFYYRISFNKKGPKALDSCHGQYFWVELMDLRVS